MVAIIGPLRTITDLYFEDEFPDPPPDPGGGGGETPVSALLVYLVYGWYSDVEIFPCTYIPPILPSPGDVRTPFLFAKNLQLLPSQDAETKAKEGISSVYRLNPTLSIPLSEITYSGMPAMPPMKVALDPFDWYAATPLNYGLIRTPNQNDLNQIITTGFKAQYTRYQPTWLGPQYCDTREGYIYRDANPDSFSIFPYPFLYPANLANCTIGDQVELDFAGLTITHTTTGRVYRPLSLKPQIASGIGFTLELTMY